MMAEPLLRLGCFVDTGFLYALKDEGDQWHESCRSLLEQVRRQRRVLVGTPLVVAETHALMLHRLGRRPALAWLESVRDWVWIEAVTPADESAAADILRRYSDQSFTLTDAISFSVLDRLDLRIALTLDRHFLAYSVGLFVLPLSSTDLPEPP